MLESRREAQNNSPCRQKLLPRRLGVKREEKVKKGTRKTRDHVEKKRHSQGDADEVMNKSRVCVFSFAYVLLSCAWLVVDAKQAWPGKVERNIPAAFFQR